MKIRFLILFISISTLLQAQYKEIKVYIHPNVEVINAITIPLYPMMLQDSLTDPWMYRNTQSMRAAQAYFGKAYSHPAVKQAEKLMEKLGTGVYLLALYYEDLPAVKRKTEIPQLIWQEVNADKDSALNTIDSFMLAAADFYKTADFPAFQKKHAPLYEKAVADIRKNLPDKQFIPALESYYGDTKSSYSIIAMPFFKSDWGMGWETDDKGKKNIVNIAAPFGEQRLVNGQIAETGFDNADKIAMLSVHEFGHSFVNTLTSQEPFLSAINKHSSLFKPIKNQPQYTDWMTLFNEHVVRAGEVLVMEQLGNKAMAQKKREEYKDWIYLNHFVAQMQSYQRNRKKHPTFKSFLPTLIDSLNRLNH